MVPNFLPTALAVGYLFLFSLNSVGMRWSRQTLFNILVIAALAGICAWSYTHRPPKLAYIESARVLESYKPMQQAKLRYQEQVALVKSLVQKLIGGLGSCRLSVGMDDHFAVA
jgi:hypothetical protein